jgi:cyclic-di-GMP phosphodiesterase TipF (flagellum assembly factor)
MNALKHVLIAAAYVLLAGAVAVVLPHSAAAVSSADAAVAGALTLVAGLFIHHAVVRGMHERAILDRLTVYSRAFERLQDEFSDVRAEVIRCRRDLDSMQVETASGDFAAMRAEMDKLQRVVGRAATRESARENMREPRETVAAGSAPIADEPPQRATAAPTLFPKVAELNETEVLEAVRDALKHDQVDLYLQPIVSLPQRKVRYYECYSRIRTGLDSMLVPEQFLGPSAREGLIGAIDNLLLFRCVQLVRRANARRHNVGFFCNISAYTLSDRVFFADFSDFVAANAELAPKLVFELSQDDVENRWDQVAPYLMRLARLGFTFSLDRVTNLDLDIEQLTRRHFRFVKFDVAALLDRARQQPETVQTLKRGLDRAGIDLIVEKIEDEAQLIEALDFHIDFGQGYLFGGPHKSRDS